YIMIVKEYTVCRKPYSSTYFVFHYFFNTSNISSILSSNMPNDLKPCQKCQNYNIQSVKFCNRCGSCLTSIPVIDIEDEFSITLSHASLAPFDSFLTAEVR